MALKAIDAELVIISNLETLNMLQAVVKKVQNKGEDGTKLI